MQFDDVSTSTFDYLQGKGVRFYSTRNNEHRFDCPLCDDTRGHLYVSLDGLYHCKKCDARGNGITIRKELGDFPSSLSFVPNSQILELAANYYHKSLTEEARAYLNERGITDEQIKTYKLGYAGSGLRDYLKEQGVPLADQKASGLVKEDGRDFFYRSVTIPYLSGSTVKTIRGHRPGHKYFYLPGTKSGIYNEQDLETETLFVCEGEFDCLMLKGLGYAAVGLPGVNSFNDLLSRFSTPKEILVCFDTDDNEAGQQAALRLAQAVGERAKIISLPALHQPPDSKTDISDFFVKHGKTKAEFELLIQSAEAPKPSGKPYIDLPKKYSRSTFKLDETRSIFVGDNMVTVKDKERVLYQKAQRTPFTASLRAKERLSGELVAVGIFEKKQEAREALTRAEQEILRARQEEQAHKPSLLDSFVRPVTLQEVFDAVDRIATEDHHELLELCASVILSAALKEPVVLWVFVTGVPSSVKTDLLFLFSKVSLVYEVDALTENVFSSGYVAADGSPGHDLLAYLDGRCLIVKDYSSLFGLNRETVKKILSDLCNIYDGKFEKFSPTRGLISYQASFSHVGAITPLSLARHSEYLSIIGPRFLTYRVPELTEEMRRRGFEIAWSGSRKEDLEHAQMMASGYLEQLVSDLGGLKEKLRPESEETRARIDLYSQFLSQVRGIAIYKSKSFENEEGKVVRYDEITEIQVEQPWRAFQQIRTLGRSLALVRRKEEVTEEELQTIRAVVLSSMPPERAKCLECFSDVKNPFGISTRELQEGTKKTFPTCSRILRELTALDVLEKVETGEKAGRFRPVEKFGAVLGFEPEESVLDSYTSSSSGEEVFINDPF
jgi:hypothetical protein